MKSNFRIKVDHYLRKRRKGLHKLDGNLKSHPHIIHLATQRPVNLTKLSHELIQLKKRYHAAWVQEVETLIQELLDKKRCKNDAANIHVSLIRALSKFDVEQAIEIGLRYVHETNDERTMKTTVNLLLSLRKNQQAWELLQSFNDSKWSMDKREEILRKDGLSDDYEGNYLDLIGRNELEIDHKPSVIVYGDLDTNIIDGSSVWLMSLCEAFTNTDVSVHLLLKSDITREVLLKPLIDNTDVKIIEPKHFGIQGGKINAEDAINLIEILDGIYGGYKSIILRGLEVSSLCLGKKSLWQRVYPYLTDYYFIDTDGTRKNKPDTEKLIPDLEKFVGGFFVQTEQIRQDLSSQFGVSNENMILLPPMIPDTEDVEFERKMIDKLKIGYSGKIAPLWGITELIKSTEGNSEVEIHIIGDKIHKSTPEHPNFYSEILSLLEDSPHVTWHGGMQRTQALELMSKMDVAWCYRSPLLESNTLEMSTKLIENTRQGIPSIVTRNELNVELFGDDYPLFVSDAKEINPLLNRLIPIIEEIDFENHSIQAKKHEITSSRLKIIEPFIQSLYDKHSDEYKRIILNGHDLKFIGEFESYLKIRGHYVRRDRWGWGEPLDIDRSKSLLNWAEVVFSEWGLANSVWYSNNISPEQKHIVRIHLQEVNERARVFPVNVETNGVNKFIFVAEHVRQEAIELFNWDPQSTILIPNYVDVNRLHQDKLPTANKTLGIIGIVPQRKRLDRALNLMKSLVQVDPSWKLIIKGKDPRNIEFMKAPNRAKEMEYYSSQFDRINNEPLLKSSVSWNEFSISLSSWYRKIGYVLSPSDFESFHYSIADGVASGAVPVIWPWDGAKEIYTDDWVIENTEDALSRILSTDFGSEEQKNRKLIEEKYGLKAIFSKLENEMW